MGKPYAGIVAGVHRYADERELTSTDLPIAEITARAGFATDIQLCTVFRREGSVSPSGYRNPRCVPLA